MYIFYNSSIVSNKKPYIHIKDRGFLLGDGIFETLKYLNGRIVFFDEHYIRLCNSANFLSIPMLYNEKELKEICLKLIEKNKLHDSTASIRITLTRGSGLRGIKIPEKQHPTLLVTALSHTDSYDYHPTVMITSIMRNQYSPIVKHKTLNYLEPILARKEANSKGFDEGIMLNIDGYIAESSIANIFFIRDKEVITPPCSCGILPGIVRNKVIYLCKKNNISIVEKNILPADVFDMDEAFHTNSLIDIQAISTINEKKFLVGNSTATNKIFNLYQDYIKLS